jgi:hypothetical protein
LWLSESFFFFLRRRFRFPFELAADVTSGGGPLRLSTGREVMFTEVVGEVILFPDVISECDCDVLELSTLITGCNKPVNVQREGIIAKVKGVSPISD